MTEQDRGGIINREREKVWHNVRGSEPYAYRCQFLGL